MSNLAPSGRAAIPMWQQSETLLEMLRRFLPRSAGAVHKAENVEPSGALLNTL